MNSKSNFKNVASRLKSARIKAGYRTAKEFTNKHDLPASTYSQHETGKRKISIEMAKKYSFLLNVHPAWLITGEDYSDVDIQKSSLKKRAEKVIESSVMTSQKIDMKLFIYIMKKIAYVFQKDFDKKIDNIVELSVELYFDVTSSSDDLSIQQKIADFSIKSIEHGLKISKNIT